MIYKNTATSTRCDGFRYLLGYIYKYIHCYVFTKIYNLNNLYIYMNFAGFYHNF